VDELYLRLLQVQSPSKLVDLGATYPDISCLNDGKTTVMGEVSEDDLSNLVGLTQQYEPDEAITLVAVQREYAMTEIGRGCDVLPDGRRGMMFLFRKSAGAWELIAGSTT
jgi:hypothetical protein